MLSDEVSLIGDVLNRQYLELGMNNALYFLQSIFSCIVPTDRVLYSATHLATKTSSEIAKIDKDNHLSEFVSIIGIRPNSVEKFSVESAEANECYLFDNSKEGNGDTYYMRDYHAKYSSILTVSLFAKNDFLYSIALMSYEKNIYTHETAGLLFDVTRNFAQSLEKNTNEEQSGYAIEVPQYLASATQLIQILPDMAQIMYYVKKVAPTYATVLITGETGSGKEVLADLIYELSKRNHAPFVKVNCGAIPETLIESSFFGYEKGAFTGALHSYAGYFEQANNGTLFLDEIGDISLHAQVILLRVLENYEIRRLGSEKVKKVDFRLIVATNKNLKQLVSEEKFREDLYYRINSFPIHMPALRHRNNDIPYLLDYYVQNTLKRLSITGKPVISQTELKALYNYNFPGNVRELLHIVERALLLAHNEDDTFEPVKFFLEGYTANTSEKNKNTFFETLPTLESLTQEYVRFIMQKTKGKIAGKNSASILLDIHPNTLRDKLEKMGMYSPKKHGKTNLEEKRLQ